ncbi:hypothetical protein ZIOFF_028926 [Zingiber officinale]|uniref:Uncharacterized protein n=1 Tax=Zingiber officinale TaxID=94328 RepID=A0A8J5LA73_ZINOF|nr:hypothetical protein ZIOFF_028926 [Zingiber officinale]
MLQLFLAAAFAAVPLTLYLPPVRNLSSFMEVAELLVQEAAGFSLQWYLAFRRGVRRIVALVAFALRFVSD